MNKLNGLLKYFLLFPFCDRHQTLNQWFSNWGPWSFWTQWKNFWDSEAHYKKKNQNNAPEERNNFV